MISGEAGALLRRESLCRIRSEEHTSELQSQSNLVCRLLLEKKKKVLRRQLALVEADTVQLDEASIVGYPQDAQWAADAINYVLDGILNEKPVHLCFGNYGGQPMLRGFWRDMVPFLNRLRTDHLVL